MKKLICFSLVLLVLAGCLSACNFMQTRSGIVAGDAESAPKVKEMMAVLAEDSLSDAKSLMHPQVAETSDTAIAQMSAYLAGREASAMKLTNISVKTSTGTAGNARQESLVYQVTLTDGAVIYLNIVYLSNRQGAGFTSFQLVLGVV